MTAADACLIIGGLAGKLIDIWGRAGLTGVVPECGWRSGMAECIRCIPGRVGERDEVSSSAADYNGIAEAFRVRGGGREVIAFLLSGNWNPLRPSPTDPAPEGLRISFAGRGSCEI